MVDPTKYFVQKNYVPIILATIIALLVIWIIIERGRNATLEIKNESYEETIKAAISAGQDVSIESDELRAELLQLQLDNKFLFDKLTKIKTDEKVRIVYRDRYLKPNASWGAINAAIDSALTYDSRR